MIQAYYELGTQKYRKFYYIRYLSCRHRAFMANMFQGRWYVSLYFHPVLKVLIKNNDEVIFAQNIKTTMRT